MKLLFDTHTFIWWDSQPNNLSQTALALLQDRSNILLLSVISIWEMQIKLQLGKITLNRSLLEIIENQQQTNQIEVLPVKLAHVLELDSLPLVHKDPFDRLLIAQANVQNAALVSCDPIVAQYPVNVIW
ncbi:type II toxin-antitoxin system VapC family toxin [Argonema galeatum]|uniref:type II toxin-antitoxin system VapC family toxin n=1 Tax=Argonema galeatum TaxID=2942762 RepID=UPI002012EF14|nr:type II toxin-antitoxin system VapC family toxin [Argonema galeatum]MCL1467292.1 type II toxin-antitoxin system VapC family toxin [Argonema galeatum A003/A1]